MRGAASGPRISVSHVFDAGALARLDFDDLADDLAGGIPPKFLHPDVLSRLEHLALAQDCATGRYLGLAGATASFLDGQTFVQLELGLIAAGLSEERWQDRLIRRLLAGMLLRAAGLYDAPSLLMARTSDTSWLRGLQDFAAAFPGAAFYPAAEGKIIPLQTVCAARGLAAAVLPGVRLDAASGELRGGQRLTDCLLGCGRGRDQVPQRLAVVDLRGLEEAVLIRKARQLYRRRCDSPFPRPAPAAAVARDPAAVLCW